MANLKSIKKGDKVLLRMFTGAFVDAKVVEMADAKRIGITNNSGVKMVFNRETGKQMTPEPKQPKFANFIEPYDADVEAAERAKKHAPKAAKPKKQKSVKSEATEVDPDELNNEEAADDFEEVE